MPAFSHIFGNGAPIRRRAATLSAAERRAIDADRRWFRHHPGRTLRLRDPAPGEAAAIAAATGAELPATVQGFPLRIVVTRIRKDLRTRRPMWTNLDGAAPEPAIHAWLELSDALGEQGYNGVIGRDELAIALGLEDSAPTRH